MEKQVDEATLQSTFAFSRYGRQFVDPFISESRASARTRHRNTRNTRNSLEAFLERGEVYDLLDAYEYSERIISDFTDVISELEERKRDLVREMDSKMLGGKNLRRNVESWCVIYGSDDGEEEKEEKEAEGKNQKFPYQNFLVDPSNKPRSSINATTRSLFACTVLTPTACATAKPIFSVPVELIRRWDDLKRKDCIT